MSFVKLENLNDFIQPSKACVKPLDNKKTGVVARVNDISLSDCLSCSGCITSAETVLVEQQNSDELFKFINGNKQSKLNKEIVVTLSLQSVSSLARKYSLGAQDAAERLASFFVSIGCHKVYDINIARHIALIESRKEFADRRNSQPQMPIISSVCPGWVCYAEKTNGDLIIPYLSKVRSPQQIMGALVKDKAIRGSNINRSDVYHVTVMPCFDKKLEASRDDFCDANDGSKDVDCVLTPVELVQILLDEGVGLGEFEPRKLDIFTETDLGFDIPMTSHSGSESGGYAQNILLAEANNLTGIDYDQLTMQYSILRNEDFIELDVRCSKEDGDTPLDDLNLGKFAIVNGFRNIQTIVQRIKRKALKYDYIEVMACPSGCINGGAQCKNDPGVDNAAVVEASKSIYRQIEPIKESIGDSSNNQKLYDKLKLNDKRRIEKMLYTQFHSVPKMQNLSVNW